MGIAEMTLTPEKLDEIERLAELATPGPWEQNDKRPVGGHGFSLFAGSQYIGHVGDSDGKTPCEANARYLAALDPATVRELVRLARIGLTSSGESGVQRGGRAIQWPEGINTAEMPEDGAV